MTDMRNDIRDHIEGTRLLDGEEPRLRLQGQDGLVEEVSSEGDYLMLTNQRLIGFWRDDGRRRRVVIPIENVDAVEVTDLSKELKPLMSGAMLLAAGAAVVAVGVLLSLNELLLWVIGGILVLLGAVTASGYFVSEHRATISFRAFSAEVLLPLRTPQAILDAQVVANDFFAVRAGQASPEPPYPPLAMAEPSFEASGQEESARDLGGSTPGEELVAAGPPSDWSGQEDLSQGPAAAALEEVTGGWESAQTERGDDV
jgi:hypothetical protein